MDDLYRCGIIFILTLGAYLPTFKFHPFGSRKKRSSLHPGLKGSRILHRCRQWR